ncbi:hypothetical protein AB0D29_33355 [Streptomyces sp. NPDC048424]|uniref:hypothetical protein n=1 Tax=Streptomyces sp. NPDC048424 TaxID=3155265 RepID=UPI003424B746
MLRVAAEARAAEIAGQVDPAPATEGRPYGGGDTHLRKVAEARKKGFLPALKP